MTPEQMIAQGAVVFLSHSGGKDNQAMTIKVRRMVPAAQLVVMHADLPEVDWPGIDEHIAATCGDLPYEKCVAIRKDGSLKTLLSEVERKGMWPDTKRRWCTSDLKRTPMEVVVRRVMAERGAKLAIVCDGRRADESDDRAKLTTFKLNKSLSKAGRQVFDWLPIHAWTETQVFAAIREAGQQPHWAYREGMSRLSCCFCILAKKADLQTAARLNPALFRRYVALEESTGATMKMPKKNGERQTLRDIVGEPELRLAA